jgi:argininosuccinate lyase
VSPRARGGRPAAATLWNAGAGLDAQMLAYTVADDRTWDARLMRWDILGSLGHAEGLRRAGLLSAREHVRLAAGLRAALRAAEAGELVIGPEHEDVHSAVELWLTARLGALGERVHTGRSRNDQVTVDLRLFLKDRVLAVHAQALAAASALLDFAQRQRDAAWPGYTHQRRAMPSSAGLWAAGYATGVLDSVETLAGLWPRLDRSPLGSAAGYGVPLPLPREAVARALGFGGIDHAVTAVQNGRGKLEAAVLFWCGELAHEFAKLSADVILFSSEEFGWLVLPPELATGSSIMPQKRNPDLFELTRARAALLDGELATVLALKGKLAGGYHRDFQFLKAPLMRGLDTTAALLGMISAAVPRLGVDRARARAALTGDILATDEVMRRVRAGEPFRRAYRAVSDAVKRGDAVPEPGARALLTTRNSTGAMGNLALAALGSRLTAARRWNRTERARFDRAMKRLAGGRA